MSCYGLPESETRHQRAGGYGSLAAGRGRFCQRAQTKGATLRQRGRPSPSARLRLNRPREIRSELARLADVASAVVVDMHFDHRPATARPCASQIVLFEIKVAFNPRGFGMVPAPVVRQS